MNLQNNTDAVLAAVRQAEVASSREPGTVEVIAVTKYVDSSIAKELVQTGICHIGENRVDQFLTKYQTLSELPITWHLIGSLQRRKVKDVINHVDYFHALDSIPLAREIQKRATKTIKCFLQVNISEERSKHGFHLPELEGVLEEVSQFDRIELVGLMTMAPFEASQELLTEIFQAMKQLQEQLQARHLPGMPFTELSMGMSGDFGSAIQHGATFVRIGRAFFREEESER